MPVYEPRQIRNLVLLGHAGSGKTTLAEAMLFACGATSRMGSVPEGNTVSDFDEAEVQRKFSVFTSMLHAERDGYKYNVLDTPGYPDFMGEMLAGLYVADTALLLVSAVEGVQVGTETAWRELERLGKPVVLVLNQLDREHANFERTLEQLRERFGRAVTAVQFPARQGPGFHQIVDVLLMKLLTFEPGRAEPVRVEPIPAELLERAEALHKELVENIAEHDDALLELYFEKGELSLEEMRAGLRHELLERTLFPVFCVAASSAVGVTRLLEFVQHVAPSPLDMPPIVTEQGQPLRPDPSGPPVLYVFKAMIEPKMGEYAFFRVYSGTVQSGMDLVNHQTGVVERLSGLFVMNGRRREEVPRLMAGDLGAVVKLRNTHTGQTLRDRALEVSIPPLPLPEPRITVAIRSRGKGEEEKMAQALHQLHEEDPTLVFRHDHELRQLLLEGQGEMQLIVAQDRLRSRFGLEVELVKPRVPYRETIRKAVRSQYRHKKQTGGAGQFAEVHFLIEPYQEGAPYPADITVREEQLLELKWGGRLMFTNAVVGGAIDAKFMPAILKGIMEIMERGPLAGYPVVDVRVTVHGGLMHPVDSNEAAFKTAARMAFKQGFLEAQPILLEPIYDVEVWVPEAYMGDVIGDLSTRRGKILGMEADGYLQHVRAKVPLAELYKYASALRSLSQGRGIHQARFSHYEPVPRELQEKIIAEAREEMVPEDV
nr:MAG: elongation factor G [Bacteroidota bacterium]